MAAGAAPQAGDPTAAAVPRAALVAAWIVLAAARGDLADVARVEALERSEAARAVGGRVDGAESTEWPLSRAEHRGMTWADHRFEQARR